jgi:hypothetical protein
VAERAARDKVHEKKKCPGAESMKQEYSELLVRVGMCGADLHVFCLTADNLIGVIGAKVLAHVVHGSSLAYWNNKSKNIEPYDQSAVDLDLRCVHCLK